MKVYIVVLALVLPIFGIPLVEVKPLKALRQAPPQPTGKLKLPHGRVIPCPTLFRSTHIQLKPSQVFTKLPHPLSHPSLSTSSPVSSQSVASHPAPTFHPLAAILGKAFINNRCNYTVWIRQVGGTGKHTQLNAKIARGHSWVDILRILPAGGISLKVAKSSSINAPITQFEYTAEGGDKVWYNISFVDCAVGESRINITECPGLDGGVRVIFGEEKDGFKCLPGEYCDKQAYFIPEAGGAPNPPVKVCKISEGIAFGLCAAV